MTEIRLVAHSAIRNSQFEIVMALFLYSFWDGRWGQMAFEFNHVEMKSMNRHPLQQAAGVLAASEFIAFVQLVGSANHSCLLEVALIGFAISIPANCALFSCPVVQTPPGQSQSLESKYGTFLVLGMVTGLSSIAALFFSFNMIAGVVFVVACAVSWALLQYFIRSVRAQVKENQSRQGPLPTQENK